jgi:hypothetical protein
VKATTEGVVRLPSEFSSTAGSPPSMTAMQEFVVPKSMPSIFAIKSLPRGDIPSLLSRMTASLDVRYARGWFLSMG